MTLQALARAIVDSVLASLDCHTFAGIPESDIEAACTDVAHILREHGLTSLDTEKDIL